MNNDIGFVVVSLDNNYTSKMLCSTISAFISNMANRQICIFNSYCEKIDTQNIPMLHISQAKFFNGDLVLFDIPCLLLSKQFPLIKKKYFYAQNSPWTDIPESYSSWKELFGQDNLNVIAKNKYLYDLYNIVWQNAIGTSENFSYEQVSQFIL